MLNKYITSISIFFNDTSL